MHKAEHGLLFENRTCAYDNYMSSFLQKCLLEGFKQLFLVFHSVLMSVHFFHIDFIFFLVPFFIQTMVAFDMDGKVRKPKFELDSEQVRYEHRFAPFNSVMTPPPVHYLQFKVNLLNEIVMKSLVLDLLREMLFVPSHLVTLTVI